MTWRQTIDATELVPALELLDETTDWTIGAEAWADGGGIGEVTVSPDNGDVARVRKAIAEIVNRLERMKREEPERFERLMEKVRQVQEPDDVPS